MSRSSEKAIPNPAPGSISPGDPARHAQSRRVLVVGHGPVADRLPSLIPRPHQLVEVPGFLSAMGDAATHRAGAVIGPASALAGMAASTAEALRRLAPHARLVLIEEPDHEDDARAALDAGFDHVLPADAQDAELLAALDLPAFPEKDPTPAIRHADPADLSDLVLGLVAPPKPVEEPSYQATIDAAMPPDLGAVASPDRPTTPIVSGAADGGLRSSGEDAELGDTDLVDLILGGHRGIDGLALRMIRAQSGLPDIDLAPPGATVPPDHAAAPVTQHEHDFGQLHVPVGQRDPVATAQRLAVWSGWLVRWLRLQAQFNRLRDLAMRDELTGAWNRRYFNRFLQRIVLRATEDRQQVTVMVFDIDDFKLYNDAYGHAAGDEILREVARLMMGSVREHDVVARIGGDEFAVIFWDADEARRRPDSKHPDDVLNAAKRFQKAVVEHRFPKLLDKAAGNLTISGGLAGFPWDGRTPDELLEAADAMAMRSKSQGKNAITVGPGAMADADDA
ncbi:MAG: GGDEF domain-containing protein [Planctomycetota bacterium]